MTNDPINVWSYLEQYSEDENEIIEIVKEVFRSGKLILGENVSMFEKEFSSFVEAKYGVGVGNGTDAIELALKAAGIKDGDEVITVSNIKCLQFPQLLKQEENRCFAILTRKHTIFQSKALKK